MIRATGLGCILLVASLVKAQEPSAKRGTAIATETRPATLSLIASGRHATSKHVCPRLVTR